MNLGVLTRIGQWMARTSRHLTRVVVNAAFPFLTIEITLNLSHHSSHLISSSLRLHLILSSLRLHLISSSHRLHLISSSPQLITSSRRLFLPSLHTPVFPLILSFGIPHQRETLGSNMHNRHHGSSKAFILPWQFQCASSNFAWPPTTRRPHLAGSRHWKDSQKQGQLRVHGSRDPSPGNSSPKSPGLP